MIRTWVLRINASAHPQSPPPPPPPLFFSASISPSSSKLKRSAMSQPRAVRIAIVGDVVSLFGLNIVEFVHFLLVWVWLLIDCLLAVRSKIMMIEVMCWNFRYKSEILKFSLSNY